MHSAHVVLMIILINLLLLLNILSCSPFSDAMSHQQSLSPFDHDDNMDDDDDGISAHYRQNCNSPGRILYTVSCYNCSTPVSKHNYNLYFAA